MKLPRSLTINGQRWRVVIKPLIHRGYMGLCISKKREIQIDADLRGEERLETFMHELLHACLSTRWAPQTEERMVQQLSPRLLDALQGIGWVK
jgi:hypothetical protein